MCGPNLRPVCGIFALFAVIASGWFGLLLGVAAIVCAILALRQVSARTGTGRGMAVWGFVYEVGTGSGEIPPGTYKTDGQSTFGSCGWSRNKDASGDLNAIISNSLKSGPQIMQVKPTDNYVTFSLGCTWIKQ